MTVEPGRQLAGRYRVEDLLADRAGARSWRAVDEVLRRSVAIDVLPSDASRASALVQAARRSAAVTDGRFLRVLDASEENGDVYVVREWIPGESLDLVLADGPLTHRRAAWMVREVAEAFSAAHGAGIYHLCLTPENILVTDTGGVKIIGLATDAALQGVRYADAEAEDVRGLGRLLYASLVARWPEGPPCGLPPAPVEHGRLLLPRQVRAGVPRPVEEVCDRILGDPPRHHGEPLRHASAVATELGATARLTADPEETQAAGMPVADGYEPTSRIPLAGTTAANGHSGYGGPRSTRPDRTLDPAVPTDGGNGATRQIPQTPPTSRTPVSTVAAPATRTAPPAQHSPRGRDSQGPRGWMWFLLVVVVVVLAGVAFFVGLNADGDPSGQQDDAQSTPSSPERQALRPVGVTSASAWDPFGEEGENNEDAPLVLDNNPGTEWTTLTYEGDSKFGGLKPGLGLVLDLGKSAKVGRVTLDLGGSGTDLDVRAAPSGAGAPPADLDGYTTVGSANDASGRARVRLDDGVSTQYLLVWLTNLPAESAATYKASISEIDLHG